MRDYPHPEESATLNIPMAILLTLVTCGFYGLYWQYLQMETLNSWLARDKYNFWMYLFLSIITCGIYAIYLEFVMAKDINEVQQQVGLPVNDNLPMLCVLLSIFGVGIGSLAIQQHEINQWYGKDDI